MRQFEEISAEDQQYINDLNIAWLESKYGKFSGSNIISLMAGVDDPVLLGKTKLKMVHEAMADIVAMDDSTMLSKQDGSPLIKPLREQLGSGWGSKPITTEESKFAFKMIDPNPEGLKTYAEKVAIQKITKFTPDPELTKPWIVRGKEFEAVGVETLSNVIDMDFEATGHDQTFVLHPEFDDYGVTADGVNKSGGKVVLPLEGKCPNTETHLKYTHIKDSKTLKEIEPRYFWQTQSQIDCHETEKGLFFSFDDRFDDNHSHLNLHFCYLERDDAAIKQIHQRLQMARDWQDKFLNQYVR